jgi:hypothetical protein
MLRALKFFASLALAAGGVVVAGNARASDYVGPNGSNWSLAGNWNPAGVPSGAAASANVSLAPAVPFNIFMNSNYTAGTALGSVNVNSSTAQMMTVTMNSAVSLFSGDELIGTSGKGTFEHSAGANTVNGGLLVGYNPGSTGIYNQSGGNVYVNVYETIGLSGNGSFNLTGGGSNTVGTAGSGQFRVAENVGSVGNYLLSNGIFNVSGTVWIGNGGNGAFTQTGGSATVNGTEIIGYLGGSTGNLAHSGGTHTVSDQYLGYSGSATGTYTLSSFSGLSVIGTQYVGYSGNGTINQSGGTNSANILSLASLGGSHGTYALSGSGSANVATMYVGGSSSAAGGMGVLNVSGGNMTVNGVLKVWDTPGTAVNLSGGTLSVQSIDLSSNPSATRFNWTDGNLKVTTGPLFIDNSTSANLPSPLVLNATKTLSMLGFQEVLGNNGNGSLTQSGGTNRMGELHVAQVNGSSGSYTLSDTGILNVDVNEYIGVSGNGSFAQTGGTHTIGVGVGTSRFDLGLIPGSAGSYNLSGGTLSSKEEHVGYAGPGTFTQSGGTHSVAFTLYFGGGGPGSGIGGLGSYSLSGDGSLIVSGFELIGASAASTFTQTGGTHSVARGAYLGSGATGNYVQSGGTFTVNTSLGNNNEFRVGDQVGSLGTYSLSGTGSLTVNGTTQIAVGISGALSATGTINQSGGTQTITGIMAVGGGVSSGGTGILNISGGAANVGTLKIWDSGAAAPGGTRVNLSGGTLSLGTLDITANPARFNWTGGTLNFTNGVVVDVGGPLGASVNLNTGMTLLSSAGTLSNNGMITLNGGSLGGLGLVSNLGVIVGNGTVGGNGSGFTNFGDLRPAGTITVGSGVNNNLGEIDITTGNTLRLTETPLVNNGTVRLNGGSVSGNGQLSNFYGGTITGRGTISGAILGTNLGNIAVSDGTLNIATQFVNVGVIQMAGVAGTLAGGAVTNLDGGTIQGFGSVNNVIINTVGTIEAMGGTLLLNAAGSSSSGLIAVSTGNKLLFTQGLASSAGIISLAGGTFDNGGRVISNSGQISGYGIFRSGALTNNGSITFAGGTTTVNGPVTNSAGKKIEVRFAPAVFTGNFINNGIFKSTSANVTFTATYTENGQFISDPATNFFENVLIGQSGAWTGGVGDRFIVSGNLINQSDAKDIWETSGAELSFIGGVNHTYTAAGSDLGVNFPGYEDNFAWGRLVLGAADSLNLQGEALYVGVLQLPGGIASITGSGTIYYDLRQPENDYLGGKSYQLAGGGTVVPVPEPRAAITLALLIAITGISGRVRAKHPR